MYTLNIACTMKQITVRDFIFEDYYNRIEFIKEICYYSMKRLKKIVIVFNKINRKNS